ncbi:MAG: YbbR-like domain-containing protein [Paludibacter sp.]
MAENSGIKFLRYYTQKLKSFFFSKDILSFLLFLTLAASFWFVNALGKDRETTISIPIRYVGIPQNVAIINKIPSELTLNVKDQGLRLFSYSKQRLTPISFDLSRLFKQKGDILFTSEQINANVNKYRHLMPTTTVLEIHPDSIFVKYEKLSIKTLAVEFVSKIELAPQYMLSNNIQLNPSRVTVFGPKNILDSMKSIPTEYVELKGLNETKHLTTKLKPIKSVRFAITETKVNLFVEQFTEKNIKIPVKSINCPSNLAIRTFPAVVDISYNVGLSHFNSSINNDLEVYLDFNDLKLSKKNRQKLKIINKSDYISNVRISPEEVDFLLEEK